MITVAGRGMLPMCEWIILLPDLLASTAARLGCKAVNSTAAIGKQHIYPIGALPVVTSDHNRIQLPVLVSVKYANAAASARA